MIVALLLCDFRQTETPRRLGDEVSEIDLR